MGFFSNCCKWLLFASNFLIFVLSCAGLGLGIWVLVDKSSFLDLLDQTDATVNIYESTAVLILIVAIGSIIITFFGCCGAHRESRCMLGTYFVLLLVLLILGLAGSITGMAQGVNRLSEPYLDTLSRYQRGRSGTIETTWDTIQRDMRCCGVNSPQDWTEYNSGFQINDDYELESSNLIQMSIKVPESCCSEAVDKRQCMSRPTGHHGAFVEGCFTLTKEKITIHTETVGGVTIAVLVIMVLNLFLSLYLCTCGIDNDDDDRPRRGGYSKAKQDRV